MDAAIRNFWWGHDSNSRKLHLVGWDGICNAKEKGGLGFRKFSTLNQAMLAKQVQGGFQSGPDSQGKQKIQTEDTWLQSKLANSYQVRCGLFGQFDKLRVFNASGFSLLGPIPDWFGQRLNALQVLDLRSSSVIVSIPPSLGGLSTLRYLYLSGNNLTGSISSSLGNLSELLILDLSRNSLTGSLPSGFGFYRVLGFVFSSAQFFNCLSFLPGYSVFPALAIFVPAGPLFRPAIPFFAPMA
ncbi:receptor-like protein 31 [Quercus suber]|uniref:receptor-like protein 31 n=1 Tax=Quercus suber TaxID=58331 RepID=UPI0032E047A5